MPLKTEFVGIINTINIWLILSPIYIFIPVSDCVGRGPSELFCLGAYNAVKTTLIDSTLYFVDNGIIVPS